MVSTNKGNSIRDVLNRGTLLSLCLSLLVGSGVVVVWQWVSQLRANDYNVRLVRETLQRDAADLLTSSMLKNYDAVGFQLKTALTLLPLKCAYIELPGQQYTVKGEAGQCANLIEKGESAHREEIRSGGMQLGPLVYILEPQAFSTGNLIYLVFGFVALVGSVVLTWSVLIKMISDAILSPLGKLTAHLSDSDYKPDLGVTCDEVLSLAEQLQQFRSQVYDSAKREEFVRVAQMVSHNIDTPVLVLEGIDVSNLDDKNQAIFRDSLSDIKGLVSGLRFQAGTSKCTEPQPELSEQAIASSSNPIASFLAESVGGISNVTTHTGDVSVEHVMGLAEMAVSEMRLQNRSPYKITFEPSPLSYRSFVSVQRTELKCMLLNLMNNAVEALSGAKRENGYIAVGVKDFSGRIYITVRDDGPGIDSAILPRLGERGFSVGKDGSGLGLHHAMTMAAAWGGRLDIESKLGKGTVVTVELPAASAPEWFVSEIRMNADCQVVVLDDDSKVGGVWARRFSDSKLTGDKFSSFTQASEFKSWVKGHGQNDVLYLVDYELAGQNQNGIGVIEELGITENSILVTGRYDDTEVQKKVRWLGIRMIPKPLAGLVPIIVSMATNPLDETVETCHEKACNSGQTNASPCTREV